MDGEQKLFCTLPDTYEAIDVLIVPCARSVCESGSFNTTGCGPGNNYSQCSPGACYS
jgi:hypothetical protein